MNIKKAIKILKITKSSNLDDLRKQFRLLAHEYHPDKNQSKNTVQEFQKIVEAYEYSLNNIKDFYAYFQKTPEPNLEEKTAKIVVENFDDIFEDIFGFSKAGRDFGYIEAQPIALTIKEFMTGVKKRAKMISYKKCPDCRGIGAMRGNMARLCTYCFGKGVLPKKDKPNKKNKPCPRCKGRGRSITKPCPRCDGFGRLRSHHLQEFYIPVGLKPFEQYKIKSHDLKTNSDTEILIEPKLKPDPVFQIEKYNLVCQYHLDFNNHHKDITLILTTPIESVPLKISKDIKSGEWLQIKQAGLYKDAAKKERGDLMVQIKKKKKSILGYLLSRIIK